MSETRTTSGAAADPALAQVRRQACSKDVNLPVNLGHDLAGRQDDLI
jgi:hypothetical protein